MNKILTLIQDSKGNYTARIGIYGNNYSLSDNFSSDRQYDHITKASARRFADLILANNPEFDNYYFTMRLMGSIES